MYKWLWVDLTNEQWKLVEPILPEDPVREDGRGRPWGDRRRVLEGVLWILRTGARRPYQTVRRRYQNWVRSGVMEKLLMTLAQHLQEAGGLDLKECFVDGTFVPAKKGGDRWGKPSGARVPRSWVLQTAMVFLSPCGQKALRRLK